MFFFKFVKNGAEIRPDRIWFFKNCCLCERCFPWASCFTHGVLGNTSQKNSRIRIIMGLNVYIYIDLFLVYETPFYMAKFEVRILTTESLASNCKAGFEKMLALYNTTIAQSIDEKCKDLEPGRFVITSISITAESFRVPNFILISSSFFYVFKKYLRYAVG